MGMTCDVCGGTVNFVGVASSAYAPMSVGFCKECLERGAEPQFIIDGLLFSCGFDNLHLSIYDAYTFDDGEYITIKAYIEKHRDRLQKEFDELEAELMNGQ